MVSRLCPSPDPSAACVGTLVCPVCARPAGVHQGRDALAAPSWATGTTAVTPCGVTPARPRCTEPDRGRHCAGTAGWELVCSALDAHSMQLRGHSIKCVLTSAVGPQTGSLSIQAESDSFAMTTLVRHSV